MLTHFNNKHRGFTLIELLVVIAIIGLLASIVSVSVAAVRNKAKDARIITNMGYFRSTAQAYQVSTGSYTGLCTNADVVTLQTDIRNQGGVSYNCQMQTANPAGASYCIEVQLNSGQWWCVDSTLRSRQYSTAPVCDAAQATKACQ